jgi:Zn finger protein HypA/HybF involved in hydrogenase expression
MSNASRKCPYCEKFNRIDSGGVLFDISKNRLFCNDEEWREYSIKGSLKTQERKANKFIADKKAGKKPAKKKRTKIELMHDKKFWHDKVAKECHSYIKERDVDMACISCQQTNAYQWDAGHFKTRAGFPQLKYNTFNIFKQCRRCNSRSGNINGGKGFGRGYVWGLMNRCGTARIEYLERDHKAKHYSAHDLKRLFGWFKYRREQLRKKL